MNRDKAESEDISQGGIYAITVTYGHRASLLECVLTALVKQNVTRIVVVANGIEWDIEKLIRSLPTDRIEIVRLSINQGSAVGFTAGIKHACKLGAEFIWLLDDDNQPCDGALSALMTAYAHLNVEFAKPDLAALAYRPDHQAEVAAGVAISRVNTRPSSFLGFHVFDTPYKLWRRAPWRHSRTRDTLPALVQLNAACYGGLLFHRAVVEKHGFPRADFVLYGDDTEFTYRITSAGGAIRLVTSARLIDLETSWNTKGRFSNSFKGWLNGVGDIRAFYGVRNGTYFSHYYRANNRFMFAINRGIYSLALWLYAQITGRDARYRLLRGAIKDGLAARLGLHPMFPL
jgi:GT2 family glycosyltransferase